MANILITGITGFIASYLAQHLSQKPENNLYGIYRSIKHESTFNALNLQKNKNINLIQGNINLYPDIEEVLTQYNINQVYHIAAKVIVKDSAKSPTTTYITNILGTLNVLEAVRIISLQQNKEIPTYIMSSDKAYGTTNILPYTEDLPLNGLEVYSSSKACEDIIARAYAHNYNLPITIGRSCNAYGVDFNWSRIIPSLAKSCLSIDETDKPLILNKGSYYNVREYIYVKDLVKAIISLIENIKNTKGQAFNISSNYRYTTEDIVNTFFKILNKKKEIQFKEKDKTFIEIDKQYLSTIKIRKAINWKPEYDLESGLKETIERYEEWFMNEMLNHCSTHEADSFLI